ncbi:hypothetical protein QE429_002236 [Bacillus sp. SORGH_AS 510]|uniref:hypothetical protein n=1 Tax=Bacillus sp. SORGH_AS_0510 TaxID=3041771 RepID=UPI0027897102|nr:hypothetical protein [Bacillus sp. SORGH_AS_0510]MDQ1145409.1 hypothetical protein [Bacillus sp. SORGH_AS_0510]
MPKLQVKLEAWVEDVNQEDGFTLQLFEKIVETMFNLIKWTGIPFVLYLLFEMARL